MSPEAQRIEMAKFDGFVQDPKNPTLELHKSWPDYAGNLIAAQGVFLKLDEAFQLAVASCLIGMLGTRDQCAGVFGVAHTMKATPSQWVEAILKATGRWKD